LSFKVQVGPPQIAIHQGQTVLVTGLDGQIASPSEKGLYFLDTRIISNWAIYANGEPWELLNGGPITYYSARIFLTNKSILTEDGPIPPRTLGLTISRSISGGLHEDLEVIVRFQLRSPDPTFDIFSRPGHIVRRGQIITMVGATTAPSPAYSNRDFHRAVTTLVAQAPRQAVGCQRRLGLEVAIQPNKACTLAASGEFEDGGQFPRRAIGTGHNPRHSSDVAMVEVSGQD
jgi:hypothetical protein